MADRAYKTSVIARTADTLAKRGRGDEFMSAYKAMMMDAVSLEEAQVSSSISKLDMFKGLEAFA